MPQPALEGNPRGESRRQLFKRAAAIVAWGTGGVSMVGGGFDITFGSLKSAQSAFSPVVQEAVAQEASFQQGIGKLARAGRLVEVPQQFDQAEIQKTYAVLDATKKEQGEGLAQTMHGLVEFIGGVAVLAAGGIVLENINRQENGHVSTPTTVFPSPKSA